MSTNVRTLVGAKVNGKNLPVQSVSSNENNDYLKLKASATVNYDLVAIKQVMPEQTLETYDIDTVVNLFVDSSSNTLNYFITDSTIQFYAGKFATTPSGGNFYEATGVLKEQLNKALLFVSGINCNIGEPLNITLQSRGTPIDVTTTNLSNFDLTHSSVVTVSEFVDGTNTLGCRNFKLGVTPKFYDHYENAVSPEFSALTGIDVSLSLTVLLDTAIAAIDTTQCRDLTLNLVRYQKCGLEPVSWGSITFANSLVRISNQSLRLEDVAEVELEIIPETILIEKS